MCAKHAPLLVGQEIWLESVSMFSSPESPRDTKLTIIDANKSTAYATAEPGGRRYAINQRTRKVRGHMFDGCSYFVYENEWALLANRKKKAERKSLLPKAKKKIESMTLEQLRDFIGEKNN